MADISRYGYSDYKAEAELHYGQHNLRSSLYDNSLLIGCTLEKATTGGQKKTTDSTEDYTSEQFREKFNFQSPLLWALLIGKWGNCRQFDSRSDAEDSYKEMLERKMVSTYEYNEFMTKRAAEQLLREKSTFKFFIGSSREEFIIDRMYVVNAMDFLNDNPDLKLIYGVPEGDDKYTVAIEFHLQMDKYKIDFKALLPHMLNSTSRIWYYYIDEDKPLTKFDYQLHEIAKSQKDVLSIAKEVVKANRLTEHFDVHFVKWLSSEINNFSELYFGMPESDKKGYELMYGSLFVKCLVDSFGVNWYIDEESGGLLVNIGVDVYSPIHAVKRQLEGNETVLEYYHQLQQIHCEPGS